MRVVSRYMCRKVICAQVLKVGTRSSPRRVRMDCQLCVRRACRRVEVSAEVGWERGCTGIPPSLAHAEVFPVFSLGRLGSFLFA